MWWCLAEKVGIKNFTGGLDFSPKYIVDSLNQSLQRLRTDYVDALLLHSPPIEILKSSDAIRKQITSLRPSGKRANNMKQFNNKIQQLLTNKLTCSNKQCLCQK